MSALYGVTELECACRGYARPTLSVDRLLGNSIKTPKVPEVGPAASRCVQASADKWLMVYAFLAASLADS